jgi:hypothetical protein
MEFLRRRIVLYRRYLAEGTDADKASAYLRQIKKDEAALAVIVEKLAQSRRG